MLMQDTLRNELIKLEPVDSEADAIRALADAYAAYARGAAANVVPLAPTAAVTAKAAMAAGLVGLSGAGDCAAKIHAGVTAFWSAVTAGLASSFAGATAIVPPPLIQLQSGLEAAFSDIRNAGDSLEIAAGKLAGVLHTATSVGGTVSFPGGVSGVIA